MDAASIRMAPIMDGAEVMNYGGWRLPALVQVRKTLDGRSGALAVWLASLLAVVAHAAAQVRSQSVYLAANLHPQLDERVNLQYERPSPWQAPPKGTFQHSVESRVPANAIVGETWIYFAQVVP